MENTTLIILIILIVATSMAASMSMADSPTAAEITTSEQPWPPELVKYLTVGFLGFSIIILSMVSALLWKASATAQQILRVFGVILILSLSSFLLIVGYGNDQLTSIIGLFGAIAGYLLWKDAGSSDNN